MNCNFRGISILEKEEEEEKEKRERKKKEEQEEERKKERKCSCRPYLRSLIIRFCREEMKELGQEHFS